MARRTEMPDTPRNPPKSRYPWKEWTDGSAWVAERPEDFENDPETFRKQVRTYARRHGLEVITSVQGNSVYFQFQREES